VSTEQQRFDVVIVGAGPTGLALANLLGMHGNRVAVIEARSELIDYPRGVGVDDETLRTFQAIDLSDKVIEHVVPNQLVIYVDKKGVELARMAPKAAPFGWPRRNGFIQPLVDAVLLEGLQRFPNVEVFWGHEMTSFTDDGASVTIATMTPGGTREFVADYLVGCDGGRSEIRKAIGVSFDGLSSSTSWLVVDLNDDPLGTPNCYVGCDPNRPYISIGLPHAVRRFEFMLFKEDGETTDPFASARRLMEPFVPAGKPVDILRAREYTHNARVAGSFIHGRVLLAGDAAHLMPVWQGQGYNTGNRDASNLGWKLDYVLRGLADARLLQTYDTERRPHATAMVKLSNLTGRFLSPTNKLVAGTRDVLAKVLGKLVPSVRDYVAEMRFKPMPTYTEGAVYKPAESADSPAGRLFIQPQVRTSDGGIAKLDDVIGHRFGVLQWENDPRHFFDDETLRLLRNLDARFITVRSGGFDLDDEVDTVDVQGDDAEARVVLDVDGKLRQWFDEHRTTLVLLRPDRIIAGASQPQHAVDTFNAVADRMYLTRASMPTATAR